MSPATWFPCSRLTWRGDESQRCQVLHVRVDERLIKVRHIPPLRQLFRLAAQLGGIEPAQQQHRQHPLARGAPEHTKGVVSPGLTPVRRATCSLFLTTLARKTCGCCLTSRVTCRVLQASLGASLGRGWLCPLVDDGQRRLLLALHVEALQRTLEIAVPLRIVLYSPHLFHAQTGLELTSL